MGRKSKFSKQQKIEICRRYLDGSESVTNLAEEINVCITTCLLYTSPSPRD